MTHRNAERNSSALSICVLLVFCLAAALQRDSAQDFLKSYKLFLTDCVKGQTLQASCDFTCVGQSDLIIA